MILRLSALLVVLSASVCLGDVIPPDVSACDGLQPGATCTTFGGSAGTCVESVTSRLDYSTGIPPKSKQVKVLMCVASGEARSVTPVLGLGLAMGAVALALATRRRPPLTA